MIHGEFRDAAEVALHVLEKLEDQLGSLLFLCGDTVNEQWIYDQLCDLVDDIRMNIGMPDRERLHL